MRKWILNIVIIAITFIALLLLIFFTDSTESLFTLVQRMNYIFILLALLCMILYWLGDVFVLHLATKLLDEKQRFIDSIKTTMVGVFVNAITPFASGGQPAQAYVMSRDGVKLGHAASILLIKSVTSQTVQVFYSLVAFIIYSTFFIGKIKGFIVLFIVGILLNLIILIFYGLFIYNRKLGKKAVMNIFIFISRFKLLKKLKKYENKIDSELDVFSEGAGLLRYNLGFMLKTSIIHIIRFTFLYAIPYLIYISIGGSDTEVILQMIAAQSLISMIASYVPLPGSSGGAEGAAYLFFGLFFPSGIVISVVFIWRLITYYFSIIVGGIISVLAPEKPLKIVKRKS